MESKSLHRWHVFAIALVISSISEGGLCPKWLTSRLPKFPPKLSVEERSERLTAAWQAEFSREETLLDLAAFFCEGKYSLIKGESGKVIGFQISGTFRPNPGHDCEPTIITSKAENGRWILEIERVTGVLLHSAPLSEAVTLRGRNRGGNAVLFAIRSAAYLTLWPNRASGPR